MPASRRKSDCPLCGTPDARRIVYGMPAPDLLGDDTIALGGCLVHQDQPRHRCRNPACAHEFGGRIAVR